MHFKGVVSPAPACLDKRITSPRELNFCFGHYSVKAQDPPRPVPKSFKTCCSVSHCIWIFHVFIWSTFVQLQGAAAVPLRKFNRFVWTASEPHAALGRVRRGALEPAVPRSAGRGGEDARDAPSLPTHQLARDGGKLSLPQPRGQCWSTKPEIVFVAVCTYS